MEEPGGVTAIVAAYNEAGRIGRVLEVLTTYDGFDEVLVIDDGSTDETAAEARAHGAAVVSLERNGGKGHAMDVGVRRATGDIVFFADADVVGLTHQMIRQTIQPVLDGTCEMFILMRNRKFYVLHRLMAFVPLLGGERAVTRRLWLTVPDRYKDRFRIETALNFYAIHFGGGLQYRVFKGISQTVKEAKFGFWEGTRRRLRMLGEVVAAAWDLQWNDVPLTDRARRVAAGSAFVSVAGLVLGILILAGGLTGPSAFFSALFGPELAEDPNAPFAGWVIRTVSALSATAIVSIGAIISLGNLLFLLRSLTRLVTIGRVREPA